jgi:hypothetical protein
VYVISDGNGKCKVGKANSVMKRLKQLQTGNPNQLFVVAVLECESCFDAESAERSAHKILEQNRVSGEWFEVSERHAENALYEAAGACGIETRVVVHEMREEQSVA